MTSRIESSPRKLKRIKKEKKTQNRNDQNDKDSEPKEDLVYNFFRAIIHPMILRLSNQKDKLNYSQWLTKLDTCEDSDYKLPLIKMLFISIKNNRTLKLYAEPPVDDLSELNFDSGDSTMDMLRKAQENTNEYYVIANEEVLQEFQHKRSAAVATDLCSYIATKTSRYLAQSFYVRSDFPIQTWHNPASITVPKTIDHNQWELYLNRFDLLMNDPALWENEPHRNTCESIMNLDQVQKELNMNCIFRWHRNSLLYSVDRPKRSAGFVKIDQDISTQSANQQELDESAFTIVHNKSFSGYKMLSPRIYSTILMPDPDFVFNMTGVRIIHNNVSHIANAAKDKKDLETNNCRQMKPSKLCPIKKNQPKITRTGSTNQQSSCSTKTTQNKNNYHKPSISAVCQEINKIKTESIHESNELNKTNNRNYYYYSDSKYTNKSIGSECNSKSRELNMSSKKQNRQIKSCMKNKSKVQNFKQFNISSSGKSSTNDTSNYDWSTLSRDDISSVQNPGSNYSSTDKNTSNNYTKQYTASMYNFVPFIKPENQNLPNSSRYSRQRNNQKYEKLQSSNKRANNFSHSVQSRNEESENLITKRNNSKRQPKLKVRSISVPCNSDRTNENDFKSKEYRKSQNDSYKTRSENEYNDTDMNNESINKYTLSAMNKYSDGNEKIYKPKYDKNWNPEITDYSGFESRKYGNGGESSPITGKNRSLQRRTSLNNLPRNLNTFSSEDESCYSDWSAETGFNKLPSSPTYSNSSSSLMSITSDFSSIENYPGLGLDISSSSKSSKYGKSNSLTKYTNNINQINTNYSISDYTDTGVRNPFVNSQKNNSNPNDDCNVNSYDLLDNYNIEDTSFPHMSYEESGSSISLINTSHDLKDMNMPLNYETSCSDDNTPIDK